MKKTAKDLKVGNKIVVAGESLEIESIELSEIGKQGKQKVRLIVKKNNGQKVTMIRPVDYPFECVK